MRHITQGEIEENIVLLSYIKPKPTWVFRYFFLASFFFASSLFAQEQRPVTIGIGAGLVSNISRTNIEAFDGSYLCGIFQNGSATGIPLPFIQAEIPLWENFSFIPSLRFEDHSSLFSTQNFTVPNMFDTSTSSLIPVSRERQYQTNIKSLAGDILIGWRPFKTFYVSGGLGTAWIVTHTFTESEKLLSSQIVYKENSTSTRTISSGNFDVNSFVLTGELAGGIDLAISPDWSFAPEIRFSFPLTHTSKTYEIYNTYSITGAIALMYALPTTQPEKIEPIKEIPPPPVAEIKKEEAPQPKNILKVFVKAVGMTESGEEVPEPVVSIQNVRVTDVAPTLNYLFFDDGSAEIPSRYHLYSNPDNASSFNPASLYKSNALGIHYEVLNILGLRMQQKPGSKITITGTRSLHSLGDSVSASDISLLRAEHAGKYLQDVWGIAPSRIKIRSRGLPEQPSDEIAATGQAENRRIEITTNTPSLLEPLETHRLERTATPPNIDFHADITSSAGIKSQVVTIRQGGKIIKTLDWLSHNPGDEMLWNIAEGNVIGTQDSVVWQMDITDSLGNIETKTGIIRIKKEVQNITKHQSDTAADKTLERFHLLLFDYSSSAELNTISDEIFSRIAASITPDSRVSLVGHTDITGDPNYNERLSYDRASRASQLLSSRLRKIGKSAPPFSLEARGAKDILFDNTNAEGRFLSRTVRIQVERDLK